MLTKKIKAEIEISPHLYEKLKEQLQYLSMGYIIKESLKAYLLSDRILKQSFLQSPIKVELTLPPDSYEWNNLEIQPVRTNGDGSCEPCDPSRADLWSIYIRGAKGAYVIAETDFREELEELRNWIDSLTANKITRPNEIRQVII